MDPTARAKALNETRARVWEEAKGFLEGIKGTTMSAEQRAQWVRYNERLDQLSAERDELVARENREAEAGHLREQMAGAFGRGGDAALAQAEQADADSFRRWLRGEGPPTLVVPAQAAAELRHVRDGAPLSEARRMAWGDDQTRALAWDTGSVGSAVPTTMARELYQHLEASVAVLRAPVRRIISDSGETREFPKYDSLSIATQVAGQGTALAGTDPTFAKLSLTPHKYGQLIKIADEVVTDNGVDLVRDLMRDLGRSTGRVIAAPLVTGSGSGQPRGIMTAAASAGSVTTGGSLIGPSYETLVDLQHAVVDTYRNSTAGWIFRDSTTANIRKLRDGAGGTEGAPIWQPSITQGIVAGAPDRLLGYPLYTDPNVASMASNARIGAFVDWSAYYVRTVGSGPVIELDRSVFFATDELALRAKWRLDADLIDDDAVASLVQNV